VGLTNPIGLLLLAGVPALFWLFRKRDRLRDARPVSTRRWFAEISARQIPTWNWQMWPLLLALCTLVLTFTWLWVQPHRILLPAATEVWDAGLNMPDRPHRETIPGKDALPQWLNTHAGEMILHTNLQAAAWGETILFPDRVRVVDEPLPSTVGIANAGVVDGKIWVQLHNTTGAPWSGTLTLRVDGRVAKTAPATVGPDGAFLLLDCPKDLTAGVLSIDGPDPWKWDDTFLVARKNETAQIALKTDNPFLKTWGQLYNTVDPQHAKTVVLTEWDDAQVAELLSRGLLVVVFCDAINLGRLETFGVRVVNRSAERERGITTAWPDLESLRIIRYTTVGETTGWDKVWWADESGRTIVGEKRFQGGTLRAVLGPLTMPETELPVLPIFIPWMSRLTELRSENRLTSLWSTDRAKAPAVTEAGVINYDRALIQPTAGRSRREPTGGKTAVVVAWNYLLWVTLGCGAIISVYLWQKKF